MIDYKPVPLAPPGSHPAPGVARGTAPVSRALALGAVIVLLAAGGYVLAPRLGLHPFAAAPAPAAALPPPAVTVAIVQRQDLALWNDFSGRLEAVNRVDIRPRAEGAVLAAHFREGALVHQGDLLFTIDPAPYQAEVDRLTAELAAAEARLVLAAREQQRGLSLGRTDDLAQNAIDTRVNEFHAAEANVKSTAAQLATARLNLGYTEVRAPISGRVGRIEVTAGNLVPAGVTAPILTTLVSTDPIYAGFDADEQSVTRAIASLPPGGDLADRIGQIPVQLGTLGTDGTPYAGHLQLVDNLVDTASGTVRVRAVFPNPDGTLMPGQFARLRLGEAHTEPVITIDDAAILTDQDRRFVLVLDAANVASRRDVTLGGLVDGKRIITAGLQPGDRIVVDGLQRVRPGTQVAPATP